LTSRICQSAALTVWLGLRPKLGAPHPWSPPTLGRPVSYIFSSRRLRNLSLIYLLALATTEQPPSCRRRVIQTPPSSDIKIARLRFLFILRLRTGIDLGDQADIAPARSVTIGSWFSDCIGASSLARRSQIVRVNSHQIGFISTHQKIGHSPSITKEGSFVHQAKYTKEIVNKFKMDDSKPLSTPICTTTVLDADEDGEPVDDINSLLYLTVTRSDIQFVVCLCACFQASPMTSYRQAVKRILRYLRYTPELGLW
jgi:hypothetical protein